SMRRVGPARPFQDTSVANSDTGAEVFPGDQDGSPISLSAAYRNMITTNPTMLCRWRIGSASVSFWSVPSLLREATIILGSRGLWLSKPTRLVFPLAGALPARLRRTEKPRAKPNLPAGFQFSY